MASSLQRFESMRDNTRANIEEKEVISNGGGNQLMYSAIF